MAADALTFTVTVDTGQGEKKLKGFDKQVDKTAKTAKKAKVSIGGLESGIKKLVLAAGGMVVLQKVAGYLRELTAEAMRFELESKRLALSVGAKGGTESTTRAMLDFAASMKTASMATEDQIIKAQSLAMNMGASTDQAQRLAQAAANLSAALPRMDMETATRQLARTLGGFRGELSEVIKEVASLTKEQRMSGEAIEVVMELYGGFDAQLRDTTTGAVKGLNDAFSDLKREIGGPFSAALKDFTDDILTPLVEALTKAAKYGRILAAIANPAQAQWLLSQTDISAPTVTGDEAGAGAYTFSQSGTMGPPAPWGADVDRMMAVNAEYERFNEQTAWLRENQDALSLTQEQLGVIWEALTEKAIEFHELGLKPIGFDLESMIQPAQRFADAWMEVFYSLSHVAGSLGKIAGEHSKFGRMMQKIQAAALLVQGIISIREGVIKIAKSGWPPNPMELASGLAMVAAGTSAVAQARALGASGAGAGAAGGGGDGGGGGSATNVGRDTAATRAPQEVHVIIEGGVYMTADELARTIEESINQSRDRTGRI